MYSLVSLVVLTTK